MTLFNALDCSGLLWAAALAALGSMSAGIDAVLRAVEHRVCKHVVMTPCIFYLKLNIGFVSESMH